MGHSRDQWNAETVLVALQPWEVEVIDRALTLLAELAEGQPERHGLLGHRGEPARAIVDKLGQVLEYQGYGGLDGLRSFLAERSGEVDAGAL